MQYLLPNRENLPQNVLKFPGGGPYMEPRHPSFLVEPDPVDPDTEEPLEVPDYYEVIQAEWLRSNFRDSAGDIASCVPARVI